jgi:transposase
MVQGFLPGHEQLEVIDDGECYRINYGFYAFASFAKDDRIALRVTVVQLVNMGVRKTDLWRCFGVSRNSIYQWMKLYREGGLEALVALKAGAGVKVTDDIKDYIVSLHEELGGRRNYRKTIIEEVERLFGVTISRETIRLAVHERKAAHREDGSLADAQRRAPVAEGDGEAEAGETRADAVGAPDAQTEEARAVEHGGALLALPLLADYDVENMVPEQTPKGSNGYSFLECFFSLLLPLMARILKVEENIKLHDAPAMGGLIGRSRLPSLRAIRRTMAVLVDNVKEKIHEMKIGFAKRCVWLGEVGDTFYLDGHFMPYMGEEQTFKGYNTGRRLAEKGRTAYVVNTPAGRPIYEILSDGFDHFRENILRVADVLREELGVARPTLVMDRGAFGDEFFEGLEEKADFICWYKGKQAPAKDAPWQEVQVPMESNTWGEPEYRSVQCTENVIAESGEDGFGYRRVFFVKRGERISPAITCKKEASLEELVLDLTRRWGAQENPFKELKKDGYDSLHSYEKDLFSEQYLSEENLDPVRTMDNPEYVTLQRERRKLQAARERILGRNAAKQSMENKEKKLSKGQRGKLEQIESRLAEIADRLAYLPEKILRIDHIESAGIVRLQSDKKKYFDLMNFLAYNARRDIAEIIGPVYQNNRDIHQTVLKFLNTSATVRQSAGHTDIILPAPNKKQEKEALQHLCETLTAMKKTSRLFQGKLVYHVQ